MPQDLWSLSGGTYLIEKPDLAFQHESLGLLSCQGLQVQTPNPEIKNPASSAGHNHFFFQWLRAKLDKVYPVLVGASL